MQFMFMSAPTDHIHSWNQQSLCPELDEAVGHASVTQVVTDADADLAPGGVPQGLLFGRQTIFHELHRNALGLLENDITGWPDNKCGVVEIRIRRWIFRAQEHVTFVLATPIADFVRN